MDQLVSLQRSGLLSMPEFLRMAREINKTDDDRREEARGSSPRSAQSEMMVDESGNVYDEAAEAATFEGMLGAEDDRDAAEEPAKNQSPIGSFDDEPDEDLQVDDEELEEESPVLEPNLAFEVGAPVIIRRGGLWSGTVISIGSNPENFLTFEKYQVEYATKQKKGRGFTVTTVQAWVKESDLKTRVVSPRKAQRTGTGDATTGVASSISAERPHMRQPDLEPDDADGHPAMAEHERGRKIQQKSKPTSALLGERKTKESTVSIAQRLREFPNQSFVEDSVHKNIFCRCCKKGDIKNIKQTISIHANSPTHKKALEAWFKKHAAEAEVKEFLSDHFKSNPNEWMSSLPKDVLLYRFNVMETFLAAGLPPTKIDDLAGLLQGDICESSKMRLFIPKVEAFEFERLRKELKDQKVTVIFDGTTRLGEAIVVLLRWCPKDFSGIKMRLVTFGTAEKHMDASELCAFINNVLVKVCQIESMNVVGGARDSCSTNGTAMRKLKVVMIALQDFLCISHTLSKLGEHIALPTLEAFMTHWLGLVQHHPSAKRLWKEETGGDAMEGYSTIRWCSREVVQNELAQKLGTHVNGFVDKLIERDIGEAHPKKMRAILDSKLDVLQNELALSLDLSRIISTVHRLEGDGLLPLLAYDEINALLIFGNTIGDNPHTLPNVARLLRDKKTLQSHTKVYEYFEGHGWFEGKITQITNGQYKVLYSDGTSISQCELEVRQWVDVREDAEWIRLVTAAKKGFAYLQSRLDGTCNNINYDCSNMWEVLRLVKAFDPSYAQTSLTPDMARDLVKITPLSKMGPALLKELPDYLSAAKDFTVDHKDVEVFTKSVLSWWANHSSKFPAWAEAARIVFSFTPNSAAAE
eukprot:6612760-Prymnesium_polylepis.1